MTQSETASRDPAGPFGRRRRAASRPVLLLLVYGAFVVLVAITAMSQVALVSTHFTTATLNAIINNDAATAGTFVNTYVRPGDFSGAGPNAARTAELEGALGVWASRGRILRAEIRALDGTVIAGDLPGLTGKGAQTADFQAAANGETKVAFTESTATGEAVGPLIPAPALREYLPLRTTDGQILAVFAVWRDATPILTQLDEARRGVVIVTLSAAAIAAALLYLIFRAAQRRITRQTAQLLEAERRDPLTSLLNHGALVAALTSSIETARRDGGAIGVALIDIDNFRLLNETYGHIAGDRALLDVGVLVVGNLPEGAVCGRYGPDEFLILADAGIVHEIEPSIERMRAALADLSLQFEASERLPITVSGGIATFPEHADSATDLLSVVATTLAEAKASGGDAVRVASIEPRERGSSGFDVLQGLVRAVDTKDRYTKRHSEDVSRYGLFIADLLDLDDATRDAIRVAGLLHDVGKIGIPDEILRKPAKLTTEEYGIVKQHVALGDLIVRDLPDIDAIRAGIRHHHERWDGAGYLTGLAGEEIPLIARILSVGDAFSAMTTTRPYRKALSIQEALKRLGDAAGSQLDESLVKVFIDGIESVPGAPLPVPEGRSGRLAAAARVA